MSAMALCCAIVAICSAYAESSTNVGGWEISRADPPHTCEAAGPVSDEVQLVIAVIGPQTKLLLSSPGFHMAAGTYPVSISIDGGPQVTLNALGEYGVYAIAMVHELGMALRSASTLTATVGDKTYAFAFQHADAAMDAASQCAGEPPYLEAFAHPPQDIPGAGNWKLVDNLQGVDRCSVRLNGGEADTILMRNNGGKLILTAGRADWAFPSGQQKITLQLDSAPPQEFDASIFDNLVFVLVSDSAMEQRLMQATVLRWHLPWGDFQANVTGMSAASDALHVCDLRKASQKHG